MWEGGIKFQEETCGLFLKSSLLKNKPFKSKGYFSGSYDQPPFFPDKIKFQRYHNFMHGVTHCVINIKATAFPRHTHPAV